MARTEHVLEPTLGDWKIHASGSDGLGLYLSAAHLIEPGKRVVLALLCCSSPVEKHSAILSSWVGKWHPFPRPNLLGSQFSLYCAIPLTSITGQ